MLELFRFIFSEWYIFFGVIVLLSVIGNVIEGIIIAIEDRNRR